MMGSSGRGLRFAVWNAHSARSRRTEIESILSEWDLDVFCISNTWLASDDVFEFYRYLTYRCDQVGGRGIPHPCPVFAGHHAPIDRRALEGPV